MFLFVRKAHFPIDAKSHADAAERKSHFVKTHSAIEKHNKKNSTFQMEHNKFSAMVKKSYFGRPK